MNLKGIQKCILASNEALVRKFIQIRIIFTRMIPQSINRVSVELIA